jgi:DNA-binding response OmpR family regulator
VEDNPQVLRSTVYTLAAAGFEVLEASDGDRALELLGHTSRDIDLLCIDGVIPGASSAEVIEHARGVRPDLGIVVCSGYVEEELLRRGIRAGEFACVRKPFTMAELLECVRAELGLPENESGLASE